MNFYKEIIALRKKSNCLIYGEFLPVYADTRIMIYQRKLEDEVYTVALNFSSSAVKVPKKFLHLFSGDVVISASGEEWGGWLLPWDGVLLK